MYLNNKKIEKKGELTCGVHILQVVQSFLVSSAFNNMNKNNNRIEQYWWGKSHDRVEKSTLAAKRLKNLAGNTQNINESKINLDS